MEQINITDYKKWLITNYFKEDTPQNIFECLSQGSVEPFKYLKLANSHAAKRYIDSYIHSCVVGKSSRISLNRYLLNLYGYKTCTKCAQVLTLQSFHKLSSVWDGKQNTCVSCRKSIDHERYVNNAKQINDNSKNYYYSHPEKAVERVRAWQNANRDKVNAVAAKRRAIKKLACPKWLSKDQQKEILNFYTQAKLLTEQTGITYQVDHIVPLLGKDVCGLHVPWNLQVITATENISKGNRYNGI